MTLVILGGGISGLSVGFYLSKSVGSKIKLFESSNRVGGWIRTIRKNNGTIFELGPRTIKCRGIAAENAYQLVKDLGITASVRPISVTSEAAKNQMLYVNNELIILPKSWTALFKIHPPFVPPFIYAIYKDLKTPKKLVNDESIYDFVARRFGKEYADILISALMCGIFAGDAKEISVKALLSSFLEKEQQYGSVLKGMFFGSQNKQKQKKNLETQNWSAWTFENGLETLPNELSSYLNDQKNVEIHLKKKCTKVKFENGKALVTFDEKVEVAEHLYSSLPSRNLADLLENEHVILKEELSAIPFVSVAVVNLEYKGDLLKKKGFGFLVPPNQNLPILGIIFDSCILPQEGKTVLTVMMGGRWFNQHFGSNPDEKMLLNIAQDHVKSILNIADKPSNSMVTVLKECIPQYIVGHSDRIQRIRQYIKDHKLPLTLTGNSFDGLGVPDAILSARNSVEENLSKKVYI